MIKSFKIFESYNEIRSICNRYNIENWELNPETGLVDVGGDVYLSHKILNQLPLKFGQVMGYFSCSYNKLTSLDGAPKSVGGYFDCSNNQLTSLVGVPKSVGGDFYCDKNQLNSLVGAPKSVGGDFDCHNNKLTSLFGSPESVGDFYCSNNQLTSLEGAPQSVGGDFSCNNNQLTTLEGSPKRVGGYFDCGNNKLTTFRGIPEYSLNEDKSFYCADNPIHEIYKLFNTPKCIDLINEYGAIGDGIISRIKLEEVFLELGLEVPKDLRFKNYKLI